MNRLPIKKRIQIIKLLADGMSVRAASRIADVSINTVSRLLADMGMACSEFQDKTMRNLTLGNVQVNEIWAFKGAKQKNVSADVAPELHLGDCYTFTAIDRDTKLIPCHMLGYRNSECSAQFMQDLASRIMNRVQLTTDGMNSYPAAVEAALGRDVDYAMLNKLKDVSTLHVERAKMTMRMGMRRFTRLTDAFSKKIEMHMYAVSLHFLYYNFALIHKSLQVTPAMAAGISDHLWTIEEICSLASTPEAKKRGHYKKRETQISN